MKNLVENSYFMICTLNQIQHIEKIFTAAQSYKVCWSCGSNVNLRLVDSKSRDNIEIQCVLCNDCTQSQNISTNSNSHF